MTQIADIKVYETGEQILEREEPDDKVASHKKVGRGTRRKERGKKGGKIGTN